MNFFKHRFFICILIIAVSSLSHAQDIHFSQYYSAPFTINPAFTGSFAGDYRAGLNYRTQWNSVTIPYQTFSLWGDFAINNDDRHRNSFGVGFLAVRDQAGDGKLSITKLMASGAYHMSLDAYKDHVLTAGFQAGWVQKSIDWSKLYFDSQWADISFNNSLPSGENYSADQLSYPDVSAGLSYTYGSTRNISFTLSASAYHLIQPNETFYNDPTNKLGVRPIVNLGFAIKAADNIFVYPSVIYMEQKKASELLAGGMVGYAITNDYEDQNILFAGMYARTGDALIPVAGYQWNSWRAMINYDINISQLKPASHGRGALEISLIYVGQLFHVNKIDIDMPCPRF